MKSLRRRGEGRRGPAVICSGLLFALKQTCSGLELDTWLKQIQINRPPEETQKRDAERGPAPHSSYRRHLNAAAYISHYSTQMTLHTWVEVREGGGWSGGLRVRQVLMTRVQEKSLSNGRAAANDSVRKRAKVRLINML